MFRDVEKILIHVSTMKHGNRTNNISKKYKKSITKSSIKRPNIKSKDNLFICK